MPATVSGIGRQQPVSDDFMLLLASSDLWLIQYLHNRFLEPLRKEKIGSKSRVFKKLGEKIKCSTIDWREMNFGSSYWGASLAQWWKHLPPTNVTQVWFPDLASYVDWVCCWFSSLLQGFFFRFSHKVKHKTQGNPVPIVMVTLIS